MENDKSPRRVSAWNVDSGALVREMFGATNYGANGGAICPTDPLVVIGQRVRMADLIPRPATPDA